MKDNEIKKSKIKFWVNLLILYVALSELKDVILVLYEFYIESGNKINLLSGVLVGMCWIMIAKTSITATLTEYKILKNLKNLEDIQDEEDIKK